MTVKKILLFRQSSHCNNLLNVLTDFVAEQLDGRGISYDYIDITQDSRVVLKEMENRINSGYDAALAFNASGQQKVMLGGENIFDRYGIPFFNYIVDHPMDHYGELNADCRNYHVICMDRNHEKLIRDYFPNIKSVHFLPLGGIAVKEANSLPKIKDRPYDVVFTGGFLPQTPQELFEEIEKYPEPYREILLKLIDYLLETRTADIYDGLKYILYDCYGLTDLPKDQFLEIMRVSQVANLFMRSFIREAVLWQLIRSDLSFHIFGNGWAERLGSLPSNVVLHDGVPYQQTGEVFRRAKIVLNVMPWFKNGTHDRIASGMLHRAAVLTDRSIYLDELPSGIMYSYDIRSLDGVTAQIHDILRDDQGMQEVADRGFTYAHQNMTWEKNVETLLKIISEYA